MFKTILLVTFLIGAAIADLKDFPDNDAFQLARNENGSFLEPPKELYDQIVKELEAIRKAVPVLANIHYMPYVEDGKAICNHGIDLEKLNSSLGPMVVEDIGHNETLITFTKPYAEILLTSRIVKEFGKQGAEIVSCRSVRLLGPRTHISRSDLLNEIGDKSMTYIFEQDSVNCFVRCQKAHLWSVKYLDGKVTLKFESE